MRLTGYRSDASIGLLGCAPGITAELFQIYAAGFYRLYCAQHKGNNRRAVAYYGVRPRLLRAIWVSSLSTGCILCDASSVGK